MSYPLFLTVTTVTVTSSLFSLFPYEALQCPEQFVGQIRGGRFSDHFRKTVATTMFVR